MAIRAPCAFVIVLAGCNATGISPMAPEAISAAAGESMRHMGPDDPVVVLGWHVEVVGDRVQWRECTLPTACTFQDRETDASNMLHAEDLGPATVALPEGPRAVEVQRITLRSGSQVKP